LVAPRLIVAAQGMEHSLAAPNLLNDQLIEHDDFKALLILEGFLLIEN
jgi:hypothetical protein